MKKFKVVNQEIFLYGFKELEPCAKEKAIQ